MSLFLLSLTVFLVTCFNILNGFLDFNFKLLFRLLLNGRLSLLRLILNLGLFLDICILGYCLSPFFNCPLLWYQILLMDWLLWGLFS
jgi:hypothetical protein